MIQYRYYIDKQYPTSLLQEKLDLLKPQSLFGNALFKESFRGEKKIIAQFNALYGALSNFVHSSHQEMGKYNQPDERRVLGSAIVQYSEEQYTQSMKIWISKSKSNINVGIIKL